MIRFLFARQYLQGMLYTLPAVLIAISVHEFAHGYMSYKLGDPTPKYDGRLTLNPFKHMDLTGTICLILFRMGWAKPVRINVARYKNRKQGIVLVSLAGPVMNYLTAFVSMVVYGFCYKHGFEIGTWFYYIAAINIGLGTFNLIPIPPLDGSNVLGEVIPKVNYSYMRIRRYAPIVLMVLLATNLLTRPLNFANDWVMNHMWSAVKEILNIGVIQQGVGNFL